MKKSVKYYWLMSETTKITILYNEV